MVTFVVLRIAAVVLLVAANAFFVAAEFALVSVRETRLQQLIAAQRIGARTVQRLHQKLDDFIAAVQFGVTLSSLALGWIGEAAMARLIEPFFVRLPHSHVYAHAVKAGLEHLFNHLWIARSRAERGKYFCFSHDLLRAQSERGLNGVLDL